jgi:hypothetical protein
MTSQVDFVQPSRVAAWLITLFTLTAEEAETILGDLHEEFSHLASKSGVAFARRWYWRQTVKTIVSLVGAAFRTAPWTTAAAVVGGYLLIGFASRFSAHAMRAFLDSRGVYAVHPDAYLFWIKFPMLTGRVILCMLAGTLVALAAKGREMTAAVTLALIEVALVVTAVVAVVASGHHWFHWFLDMLPWNCAFSIAIVVGAAIVRTRRSAATTRPSAT